LKAGQQLLGQAGGYAVRFVGAVSHQTRCNRRHGPSAFRCSSCDVRQCFLRVAGIREGHCRGVRQAWVGVVGEARRRTPREDSALLKVVDEGAAQ
jgi:hypothetical protein